MRARESRLELTTHLKTAKQLGLSIRRRLLPCSDSVRFLRDFCRSDKAAVMPLHDPKLTLVPHSPVGRVKPLLYLEKGDGSRKAAGQVPQPDRAVAGAGEQQLRARALAEGDVVDAVAMPCQLDEQ